MTTGIRETGDFCWINIVTPDPAEAMEFFARVLGWKYFEMSGIGHGMQVDGRNIGGIFDINGPNCPPGMSPVIGVMVKVDNADAACEKIVSLGGKAKPAFDIGDQGRMAVCHDPNGCEFDIWEPKKMPGTDADTAHHGSPSWSESVTTDVRKATEFYCDLFGWTAEVKHMPGMDYTVFKNGGTEIAGMMPVPPHMGSVPPHWGTYFSVNDADLAARVAESLGAKLCVPPTDIPGIGRFCGITSPQGVTFYAIKYLPRQGS
jgi:predicted enzyme related to lactoylglutathione lyase